MSLLKSKIMRHLATNGPATVNDVTERLATEMGLDPAAVEQAMRELIQCAQLKRMAGPDSDPVGKIDGKYGSFNEKRLGDDKGGTFEDHPWKRDIKGPRAV